MNHRTQLSLINNEAHASALAGLHHLRRMREFKDLVTILEQELVQERNLFESSVASEFNRGQVVMLKKVLYLLTGDE